MLLVYTLDVIFQALKKFITFQYSQKIRSQVSTLIVFDERKKLVPHAKEELIG